MLSVSQMSEPQAEHDDEPPGSLARAVTVMRAQSPHLDIARAFGPADLEPRPPPAGTGPAVAAPRTVQYY